MKLHLPKLLLTAVLAVVACQTTVQASEWNTGPVGTETVYYVNETTIDTFDTTVKENETIYLNADVDNNSLETTIGTAKIKEGQLLYIDKHAWDDVNGTRNFKLLTIQNLQIVNGDAAGAGSLRVGNEQTVSLGSVSGTLTSLAVDAGGSLTLNNAVTAGSITIDANGKLATKAAQDYSKVSGAGSLIINYANANVSALTSSYTGNVIYGSGSTASINGGAIKGSALYVDGGSVTLSGGSSLTKSVYVTNKGTLTIGVTDLINTQNQTNQTISIDDSTLAIGDKRFALSLTHKLVLNNATVTGTGDNHGAIDLAKGGTDNVVGTHYITASGNSSIAGVIRVRDGNTASFDVAEGGTLTVGTITKGNGSNDSSIAKTGAGTLKITSMDSSRAGEAFIQGTTTITEGTLEYALAIKGEGTDNVTSSFTYSGVVKGAGTLAKSGTAGLVLNKVTDFSGKLDVKEGSLTISSLDVTKTIDISVSEGAALTLGTVSLNVLNQQMDIAAEGTNIYYTMDGTNATTNGFYVTDTVYYLFKGYEWSGQISGVTVDTTEQGDTVVSFESADTTFVVNEGTHVISTAGDYINGRATGYVVEEGATLKIDGIQSEGMTAAQILKTAVGNGNALLTTDVQLNSGEATQLEGALTIQNATLTMGTHKNDQVSVSSFDAITLDNGVIEIKATTTSFEDVTVTSNGGSLKVKDMPDSRSPHLLTGTTTIQKGGTFTIETSEWRSNVKIESLTGEGNLVVKDTNHSTNPADNTVVNISALQNFTGAITVDGGTDGVTSLIIDSNGETTLSAVTLRGGGSLKMMNKGGTRTTNITSLTIEGSATLGTNRDPNCHNGTINIGELTGTGATLTLKNGAQTDNATVFNINGGSYAGTINLEADSAKGQGTPNRKLHMYVNNATALQSAVINFQDPSTATATDKAYNYITFGVGIDNAKVAGISGTTTNAAVIKSTEGTRSLEINVAENQKYASNAKVENSINLVKTGAGEQAFSSDMSAYTGAVKVSGGKLALTNAAEGANTTLTSLTLDGGALDVTGTLTLSNVTVDLSKYTAGTNIELVTAGTLNGELNVSYADGVTTVGNYTGTLVAQDGSSLWLTWKDATPTVSSITTSVSTEEGWYTLSPDGTTLTLTVDGSLAGLAEGGIVELGLISEEMKQAILASLTNAETGELTTTMVTLKLTDGNTDNDIIAGQGAIVGFFNEKGEGYWGEMVGSQLMYNVERIPEPTTATLSLLALMGLAARRRRQK